MRVLVGVLGLVFLLGSVPADAGWWIFGKKDGQQQEATGSRNSVKKDLPKPIDFPIVRPKLQETHKQGKRAGNHPEHNHQQN